MRIYQYAQMLVFLFLITAVPFTLAEEIAVAAYCHPDRQRMPASQGSYPF